MVFCREMGWKEEDEAVDALEGVCNMTDMLERQFFWLFFRPDYSLLDYYY